MSLSQVDATSQQRSPEPVYMLGVRVDRLSQRAVLDRIEQVIARRRASNQTLPCQQIVTVNPEFVMAAQHNKDFRAAINAAALVIADGAGGVWGGRDRPRRVAERATCTVLLPALGQ